MIPESIIKVREAHNFYRGMYPYRLCDIASFVGVCEKQVTRHFHGLSQTNAYTVQKYQEFLIWADDYSKRVRQAHIIPCLQG